MATKTNPNGANQFVIDPRQNLFLEYYFDPQSDTFSNALQSALKAGYAQEYAENITTLMPKWLLEKMGEARMTNQAEKNLQEILEMDIKNTGVTKDGKTIYEYDDVGKLRVKSDVSQFVLERLRKEKYGNKGLLDDLKGKGAVIIAWDNGEDNTNTIQSENLEQGTSQ